MVFVDVQFCREKINVTKLTAALSAKSNKKYKKIFKSCFLIGQYKTTYTVFGTDPFDLARNKSPREDNDGQVKKP